MAMSIVKNKTGDTSDVNNVYVYCPRYHCFKQFEIVLLDILQTFMKTCDNQFGFKKAHSTEHSIFVLKHVIDYYRSLNSPVYSCFLDASKCFDKIDHWSRSCSYHTVLCRVASRSPPCEKYIYTKNILGINVLVDLNLIINNSS